MPDDNLIVYGWGSHSLAQFSACPKGTDPKIFAVLQSCLAVIRRDKLKFPTDHRSLIFSADGIEFLGTWGNSNRSTPTRQNLQRIKQESRPAYWAKGKE